jgi:hypothetical protein
VRVVDVQPWDYFLFRRDRAKRSVPVDVRRGAPGAERIADSTKEIRRDPGVVLGALALNMASTPRRNRAVASDEAVGGGTTSADTECPQVPA